MLLQKTIGAYSTATDSDMVLEYDTSLGSLTIDVMFDNATSVNCTVDWGDGTSTAYTTSGTKSHTYATGGIYEVRISGSLDSFGGSGNYFALNRELTKCLSFGRLGLTSLEQAFDGCLNLTEVPAQIPIEVTNAFRMFYDCRVFNQDISQWNTSSITNMDSMFYNCDVFNQNISAWNVSNVTNVTSMFENASAFNQNIGAWDMSSVTQADYMFRGASSFNQDIGNWNMVNCSQMSGMFENATAFNQDLTGWCVGAYTSAPGSFSAGSALTAGNLPVWGTCPTHIASGSLTYIGEANGTTSATLPTHQAGDLIIAFAFRDGSTTQPTIPAEWTSWNSRTGTSCCGRIAYQVAASSGTTSGTWTNATTVIFLVYRGALAPTSSTSTSTAAVSTTVNYPAQSTWQGLSRVIAFSAHRSVDTNLGNAPGSLSLIVNPVDATDEAAAFQSTVDNYGVWSSTNVSVGGTSSGYVSFVARVRVPIELA